MADLISRGVTFEEYETPKTTTSSPRSARLGARGSRIPTATSSALREGPVPGAG